MTVSNDSIDIATSRTPRSWSIEKCSDIKRSLSARAHNARREQPLSVHELRAMAMVYRAVDQTERVLREDADMPYPAPWPAWVRNHV